MCFWLPAAGRKWLVIECKNFKLNSLHFLLSSDLQYARLQNFTTICSMHRTFSSDRWLMFEKLQNPRFLLWAGKRAPMYRYGVFFPTTAHRTDAKWQNLLAVVVSLKFFLYCHEFFLCSPSTIQMSESVLTVCCALILTVYSFTAVIILL